MFYIQQRGKYDCGFTALKVYLANYNDDRAYLYLASPLQEDVPYSFLQLINYAKEYGFNLKAYQIDDKENLSSKEEFPMLFSLSTSSLHHLVMVYKVNRRYVYYLDPCYGKKKVPREEFLSNWDGKLLKIEGEDKKRCPVRVNNLLTIKEKIVISILEFLSFADLLLGIFFIKEDIPLYVPIICLAAFAITEIILRNIILLICRNVDKRVYNPSLMLKRGEMRHFYNLLEENKQLEISLPLNAVYYSLFLPLTIFVIAMNGTLNFYYVLFGVIFALAYIFLLSPYLKKKNKEIVYIEEELKDNEDLSLIKKAHQSSYQYGRIFLYYRYTLLAVSLIGIILIMALSDVISIPYVIFYLVLNVFLYKGIIGLYNLLDQHQRYYQNYLEMINLYDKR